MIERSHVALDALARHAADEHHCPSIVWGMVSGGSLVTTGSIGALDDGTAPTDRTIYRIASMTKSFTAAAELSLRDEGALSLDVPVVEYAPELASVRAPDGSPPITLRHLLSMTAGLATDDAWADRHLDATPDEMNAVYVAEPAFAHLTNVTFEYSNLGFGMIGRTVFRATGKRVQDHVTSRLLEPLGLRDTTWIEPDHDGWARPYRWQDERSVPDLPHPIGDGEISPMGGLWTNVRDLATWVAWLDDANTTPHQPGAVGLCPASRREMQRINTYVGVATLAGRSCPSGYGFGLNVRDDPALGTVVAHSGGLPGYGTNMRWLAGRGVGVIALANTTYAPMSDLTMRMLVALHDLGAVPTLRPVATPAFASAAQRLVALLDEWSDDVATTLFADNMALDEPFDRRAAEAALLVERHGHLRLIGLHPESATSGTIEVRGDGSPFRIRVQLAPLAGAPVQLYDLPE